MTTYSGPRWTAGLLTAFMFVIAAGVAVWGTFEKLHTYVHRYGRQVGDASEYRFTDTWWSTDVSGLPGLQPVDAPPFGALPATAAGLLVVAAVLALNAYSAPRAGLVTAVRVCAGTGVGILAGVAVIRLLDVLQGLNQAHAEKLDPGESAEFQIGLGIWLPCGAAVLAIAGLAITLTRVRIEPDTPRMGIPMPHLQQHYQPYAQQPTPGQQVQPAVPQPEQPNPPAD